MLVELGELLKQFKDNPSEATMLMDHDDACRVYWLAQVAKRISGDFAEVGVYQGATAKLICEVKGKKTLHLFDTFTGFPEVNPAIDGDFYKGQYRAELEPVTRYLAKYKNVHIYKGRFPESALKMGGFLKKHFSFIHLDLDLFESTIESLWFFYPRMEKGGIIIIHDYPITPAVKKAVDDFFDSKPEVIIRIGPRQCLIVRH